jgi:small subunit ribosomal protein S5
MLEVRRVTRVTTGGRQLSFRATMLIGNKNGKVGLGIAKANDVQSAVSKATHDAYKNIVDVTITADGTVPYPIAKKFKSAQIKLVPAKPGT